VDVNYEGGPTDMDRNPACLYKTLVVGVIFILCGMNVISSTGNALKVSHPFNNLEIVELASNGENDTTPPVTTRTLDPPEPDGLNGWYVCDVFITLNATDDLSGVKIIKYVIDGWSVHIIYGDIGSFLLVGDGEYTIEYYAIDNAGNVETTNEFEIKIDQNIPECRVIMDIVGGNMYTGWDYLLTTTATDETSGMERVEFYINSELQETVYGPGPEYTWQFRFWPLPRVRLWVKAYDNAGLIGMDEVITSRTSDFLLNQIFSRFSILEKLMVLIR
jgi:hypothetical protein